MIRRPRIPAFRFPSQPRRYRHKWSLEKLTPIEKYPLTVALATRDAEKYKDKVPTVKIKQYCALGDEFHGKRGQNHIRSQIVNPDLCDDVLKYIGSTLTQYKGCDILDLNPGVGLWSQKVHDFLRPRSHMLVEPSETYDRWLKPLVELPGSTYSIWRGDVTKLTTFKEMAEAGAFPHQKLAETQNVPGTEMNKSLLVIGNLTWDPPLPGYGFSMLARQTVTKYIQAMRNLDGFHAFGPVRMLLWSSQEEMRPFVPLGITGISKYQYILNEYSDVTMCATTGPRERARRPQYDIESVVRTIERAKKSGFNLPEHRCDNIHEFAKEIAESTGGTGKISSSEMRQYLMEKEYAGISTAGLSTQHEIEFYRAEQELLKISPPGPKGQRPETPIPRKHISARATLKRTGLVWEKVENAAIMGEEVYNLECEIVGMPDGPDKEKALATLESKEMEYENALKFINGNFQKAVVSEVDDRIALHASVPRLQWDKRPYEPLIAKSGEVWPAIPVSLLDIVPRPMTFDPVWFEWVTDFCFAFFDAPFASVRAAMEHVQPGASCLLDQVPALTDPKKGGRLNMNNLRVRMLTPEMIEGLCKAYHEWPFKNVEARHKKYFQMRMTNSRQANDIATTKHAFA
ncbi:unnamed protein product [Periconia digitata]|uniref:Mitochondrial transcription factor 1 n=1 Tax=Periconia digitata TaxID=1303443 RepID=A0A9W4XXT8_9PLEO|nr:unnamed protein product [Periconia digitata]